MRMAKWGWGDRLSQDAGEILAPETKDGEVICMSRTRLSRLTVVALALLASTSLLAQRAIPRVRVVLPAYRTPIALDTIMQRYLFTNSPAEVWTAASKAFYDLKIATDMRDSAQGIIGITHLQRSNSFGGQTMGRLLNCGMGITGPNADNFRINLALVAFIIPANEGKTELGVAFIGSGMDMRGSSSDPVACAPSGIMESVLAEKIGKTLNPAVPIMKKPGL
jgi:hypothetical protein